MRIAVIGAGVIGLAAADALLRRGADVVSLEADTPMAARSTGDLGLPVRSLPGPALVDPAGGVIDVCATGAFLRAAVGPALRSAHVYRLVVAGDGVVVHSSAGPFEVDRVVVAAGRGTCQLAAQVGVYVPTALAHHVRFTFPLGDPSARPPCWMDRTESWRPGFTTYQHLSGHGLWSVGAELPAAEQAWERGRAAVTARSRDLVRQYVREALTGVEDEIVAEVYCDFSPDLGDGIHVAAAGPTTFLWGDNLFKHAPAIGTSLAIATMDGTVPDIPRSRSYPSPSCSGCVTTGDFGAAK